MPVSTCSFTSDAHCIQCADTHTPQQFIDALTITHSPHHINDPDSLSNAKISPPTNSFTCTEHNISHIDTIQAAMVNAFQCLDTDSNGYRCLLATMVWSMIINQCYTATLSFHLCPTNSLTSLSIYKSNPHKAQPRQLYIMQDLSDGPTNFAPILRRSRYCKTGCLAASVPPAVVVVAALPPGVFSAEHSSSSQKPLPNLLSLGCLQWLPKWLSL
jgi:hypothetical protein